MVPAVNQIEVHPYLANDELRAYGQEHGIVTQAWSPLARGQVLSDPIVMGIAERLERTPSQVVLRWHVQRGDVVFPKTMSVTRMRENLDIFGFELDAVDVEAISRPRPGRSRAHRAAPRHVRLDPRLTRTCAARQIVRRPGR